MKKIEPRTLAGFMELMPEDQIQFNNIKNTIIENYEKFGFLPIDTPVIEDGQVLLAKAGGETEKQIYRAYHSDPTAENLVLRFDLTVPLAKYVAKHYNELSFPFRRYQIGKVYRGERPQKGRFREFYQCDIDIIGKGQLSIINDAEVPSIIYSIFRGLGFESFKIEINNRKFLTGFLLSIGIPIGKHTDILRILDKSKKVSEGETKSSLLCYADEIQVNKLLNLLAIKGSVDQKISWIQEFETTNNEFLTQGINELTDLVKYIRLFGVEDKYFDLDFSIVRGLDYYTGTVYETFIEGYEEIGSVCSGGRYENLAGYYTDEKLPGVGISIGLTRLFDKLKDVIKLKKKCVSDVIIVPMSSDFSYAVSVASMLRNAGVKTEVCCESVSFKSKLKYANRMGVKYIIIVGEDEEKTQKIVLKNMVTAEQQTLNTDDAIKFIKEF